MGFIFQCILVVEVVHVIFHLAVLYIISFLHRYSYRSTSWLGIWLSFFNQRSLCINVTKRLSLHKPTALGKYLMRSPINTAVIEVWFLLCTAVTLMLGYLYRSYLTQLDTVNKESKCITRYSCCYLNHLHKTLLLLGHRA